MTYLEFLTLFGSFTNVGQENVSNSQTQQIRETLAATLDTTQPTNLLDFDNHFSPR